MPDVIPSEPTRDPRWDIYLRDRCKCVYCGFDGSTSFRAWYNLDEDHLYPQNPQSGTQKADQRLYDDPRNIVIACRTCNAIKSGFVPSWCSEIPEDLNEQWRMAMIESATVEIDRRMRERRDALRQFPLMLRDLARAK